jgi:ribonuclease III
MAAAQQTWTRDLQQFIYQLLEPIIPNQQERLKYIDAKAMADWVPAFTHESFSPSNNYESYEYLGDAILKAAFPKYLLRRLPHLDQGELSELNTYYMSKMKQAEISQKMGLAKHLRVIGLQGTITNLDTDMFESFFGALDTVADRITPGLGFGTCYNMVYELYKNEVIDESKKLGSSKTQTQQIFKRFGLPELYEIAVDNNRQVQFLVGLLQPHLDFLLSHGVNAKFSPYVYNDGSGRAITMYLIGNELRPTKKDASTAAYDSALALLTSFGVTSKWATDTKRAVDFAAPDVAKYVPQATAKLQREGYVSMYFFISSKTVTKDGSVVQLIGVTKDNKKVPLAWVFARREGTQDNNGAARAEVIKKYATS